MTIDIITALDQAFYQAETAQNDQVRTQAIQHFINVAGILEQQLLVAGMDSVTITGDGKGEALSPFQSVVLDHGLLWTPVAASEQPEPPAPDVINMTNPANWLPGDMLLRKTVHGNFPHFTSGKQYTVTSNGPDVLTIMGNNGVEVTYPHKPFCEPASNFFTWLRHGNAPTTQA